MSNKKRKRLVSPTLSNVPLVEPKVVGDATGNESLAEFRRRYNREQRDLSEAQRLAVKAFWARPQSDLVQVTLKNLPESAADAGLNVEQGPCSDDASGTAHEQWRSTAPAGLNEEGHRRLLRYGITQLRFGKNMGTVSAWQACHDRLVECDCYGDELANQPKKPESPKPTTLDNILNSNNGETTEGRKRMVDAVKDSVVHSDWANCFAGFKNSLYENFGGFILNDRQTKTFIETMWRRNLNLNRPADYDMCRISLVKSGDLPSHLLYPAEKLALEVEDADMNDRNVRQAFARRTRLLATQN
jgi:hypothetical protein